MDGNGVLRGAKAIAFDVYGTLIDVTGVADLLSGLFGGGRGPALARRWREKQLEYTFRRALMGRYADFGTCTRQALRWTCAEAGLACEPAAEDRLMAEYARLPPYPDARVALGALRDSHRLFAFSNGTAGQVREVLANAGIAGRFHGVVSVDEVSSFKPDPRVYRHFLDRAGVPASEALLVSANTFDIAGAVSAGMRAAWVNRAGAAFDPWEFAPTVELSSLTDLGSAPVPA